MRFGTWNVSLYSSVLLTRVTRELARYKLDLVGVRDVRWVKAGTVQAGEFFSVKKEAKVFNWKQDFSYTTEYYQQLRE